MATIQARGYVNRPETKTTKGGRSYSQFQLGVKQKEKAYGDRPEKVTWANFAVTDFNNATPPTEKAYVTVEGYFKERQYEHNGVKRTSNEINASSVVVAESYDRSGGSGPGPAPAKAGTGSKAKAVVAANPWDSDDLPF